MAGSAYSTNNITANGAGDSLTIGTANNYDNTNNVTTTGAGDTIIVNANDGATTLTAGNNDPSIIVKTGSSGWDNTITAGSGNTITVNNIASDYGPSTNTVTAGSGSAITFNDGTTNGSAPEVNTATVTTGSTVTFNALSSSVDTFNVGGGGTTAAATTVAETNGTSTGLANGANDVFLLNGVNSGSTLSAVFNKETIKFGLDSSDTVSLGTAPAGDILTVQAEQIVVDPPNQRLQVEHIVERRVAARREAVNLEDTAAGNYAGVKRCTSPVVDRSCSTPSPSR